VFLAQDASVIPRTIIILTNKKYQQKCKVNFVEMTDKTGLQDSKIFKYGKPWKCVQPVYTYAMFSMFVNVCVFALDDAISTGLFTEVLVNWMTKIIIGLWLRLLKHKK